MPGPNGCIRFAEKVAPREYRKACRKRNACSFAGGDGLLPGRLPADRQKIQSILLILSKKTTGKTLVKSALL
jgi:hypothetical protein